MFSRYGGRGSCLAWSWAASSRVLHPNDCSSWFLSWSAAARLLLARQRWRFGDDLPKGPAMKLYGFGVGVLATLMGIGGGLFSNLVMTFYGRPLPQAVAT